MSAVTADAQDDAPPVPCAKRTQPAPDAQPPAGHPRAGARRQAWLEVEQYFNSIRTFAGAPSSRAIPTARSCRAISICAGPAACASNTIHPSQLKIVADGNQVTMWDIPNRDFSQWPIGWTAASFPGQGSDDIVGRPSRSSRSSMANGEVQLTLVQTRASRRRARSIVRLAEGPLLLRGWSIIDFARPARRYLAAGIFAPACSSPTRCSSTDGPRRPAWFLPRAAV